MQQQRIKNRERKEGNRRRFAKVQNAHKQTDAGIVETQKKGTPACRTNQHKSARIQKEQATAEERRI